MTCYHDHYEIAAKKIIQQVGNKIVIGVPLGIGKPIGLLNALYQIAERDSTIQLTIITGLTLARPHLHQDLEKRLVKPILDRLLKDYEDPLYEKARLQQNLPSNIKVIEFFISPGKFLHNAYVQQNYNSCIYTNMVRDAEFYSVNVIGQQVPRSQTNPDQYSLSSNSDLFHGMATRLKEMANEGKKIAVVAEVNLNLPFMYGEEAVVSADVFTDIIDTKKYRTLFALPREELSLADHAIGIYTSALIKDGSCLQIGIGKLSNAIANALIFRQQHHSLYLNLLDQLSLKEKWGQTLATVGSLDVFNQGLYASTEMLSDEYIELYQSKILKKRVYDHIGLQQLLNLKKISEIITPNILDVLLENHLIQAHLSGADFEFLQKFGIFKADIQWQSNELRLPSGETIPADLTLESAKQAIIKQCLGHQLKSGKIIHAGFFLGSRELYQALKNLALDELQQFQMTSITRTNTLWCYELSKLQRQDARLINSAMMITLSGAVISDGLKDCQEVSGVGGQFDFISMAQKLPQSRSIIICRSHRTTKSGVQSNIVWEYPNLTIPRYLRDIFITEYGIADCRSKTDSEVMAAILNITDSRFQNDLLQQAKKAGKLPQNFEILPCYKNNYPDKMAVHLQSLQAQGFFQSYPFGSDLTPDEIVLSHALLALKDYSVFKLLILIIRAFFFFQSDAKFAIYLQRMNLHDPKTIKDWIYKKLLKLMIWKNTHGN